MTEEQATKSGEEVIAQILREKQNFAYTIIRSTFNKFF
jgi:hypothetical protein